MTFGDTNPERIIAMRTTNTVTAYARAMTDHREGAVGVDVLLREEEGETLMVRSSGLSVDAAIERAANEVERRLGGSWGCDDWFAAS